MRGCKCGAGCGDGMVGSGSGSLLLVGSSRLTEPEGIGVGSATSDMIIPSATLRGDYAETNDAKRKRLRYVVCGFILENSEWIRDERRMKLCDERVARRLINREI
jgi:hypothetical protein